jgi:hypothetical protein
MKKPGFLLPVLLLFLLAGLAGAQETKRTPYPEMAPVEQYLIADPQDEIALARTAAPPSISADAEVLVLRKHGYETAVKGRNGFVCFIERSWTAGFDDAQFWNSKLRAPNCFNPPAVRSVLPQYLKRTEWVLAGVGRAQMVEKARAAFASGHFAAPEAGSLSYMLSKQGYVSDDAAGPWLPHVMFFVPHGEAVAWGAGLKASPILGADSGPFEPSVLLLPVRLWSDGSPAPAPAPSTEHHHSP